MNFKGIVLAGGKSSRFGEDKALAKWQGKTLLEIAVNLLGELCLDPAVIANPSRNYSFLPCAVVDDLIPEKGPLGGLYTACSIFPDTRLLILTCDMPFLTEKILRELMEEHQSFDEVTVFGSAQPFPGIYSAHLKSAVQDYLESGCLSMKLFLSNIRDKRVLRAELDSQVFKNVNHREDLSLTAGQYNSKIITKNI